VITYVPEGRELCPEVSLEDMVRQIGAIPSHTGVLIPEASYSGIGFRTDPTEGETYTIGLLFSKGAALTEPVRRTAVMIKQIVDSDTVKVVR